MNLLAGRLLAIGVAVVLVTAEQVLERIGFEYAFEDSAGAAFLAAAIVAVADLRS